MSILVDKNTRVVTQGITGATGQIHTRACKEYGTQMVAGVVPWQGRHHLRGHSDFRYGRAGAKSYRM